MRPEKRKAPYKKLTKTSGNEKKCDNKRKNTAESRTNKHKLSNMNVEVIISRETKKKFFIHYHTSIAVSRDQRRRERSLSVILSTATPNKAQTSSKKTAPLLKQNPTAMTFISRFAKSSERKRKEKSV